MSSARRGITLAAALLGLGNGCFAVVDDSGSTDKAGESESTGDDGDGDGDGDPGDGDPGDGDPGDGDGDGDPGDGDGDPGDGDGDGDGDPGDGDGDLPPGACNGPADCLDTEFCDFPDDFCGELALGECAPRPNIADCPNGFEVTGCDCQTYPGGCEAAAMGADFKCIGNCC